MGTMIKRILSVAALAALLVPASAHARTTTYTPSASTPYVLGPQNGDANNTFERDPVTGELTAIRHQLAGTNGTLGCGGNAGWTTFEVTHDSASPVRWITVAYADAVVDAYTFMKVTVRQDEHYLGRAANVRGVVLGRGVIRVEVEGAHAGPITTWFGIEVPSACPNIDGGTARFTAVSFTEV